MTRRSADRTQFLADIIVTATEGGTGYWALSSDYHWSDEHPETTTVTVHEMWEEGDDGEPMEHQRPGIAGYFGPQLYRAEGVKVTIDTVARAVSQIITSDRPDGQGVKVGDWVRKDIAAAASINDAGMIDSILADVIVQVAALGEIVYG